MLGDTVRLVDYMFQARLKSWSVGPKPSPLLVIS